MKLDENLGRVALRLLTLAGHDVATVHGQSMCGAPDASLIACCRDEERCLVTLDAEFGNPIVYPPGEYRGIVLIRVRPWAEGAALARALQTLVSALGDERTRRSGPDRGLWIVPPGRVRVYQPLRDPEAS
jgi:predicted nuclease of predicted toxin-antitoxin system